MMAVQVDLKGQEWGSDPARGLLGRLDEADWSAEKGLYSESHWTPCVPGQPMVNGKSAQFSTPARAVMLYRYQHSASPPEYRQFCQNKR